MSDKKYGVIFAPTTNIGDDIQTLAAINFLKKKGIVEYTYLNREELHDYDGDEIYVVMNGWFMHRPDNFPPSNKIIPIWISFNISNAKMINEQTIDYFKSQPPIGCRDLATVELLRKHDIDAYFTGCLTLFFDKHARKGGGKYLVDVNGECPYVPTMNLNMQLFEDFKVIEHEAFKMWDTDVDKRLKLAAKLLDDYREASLVITSRLHCALPCRAFGTSCVFMHKRYSNDRRFTGLKGVLNGGSDYHYNTNAKSGEMEKILQFFNKYIIEN